MTPGRAGRWAWLGLAGLALVAAVPLTTAAFTDTATVALGTGKASSAVGNPNRFDIAVKDTTGAWQDAGTSGAAVTLTATSGTAFSETDPVVFDVVVLNRAPGVSGDLVVTLWDPDATGATDLYAALRFTVTLDGGSTPAIVNATATAVNAATVAVRGAVPGVQHTVRVSALLAAGTGSAVLGQSTSVGVHVTGQST